MASAGLFGMLYERLQGAFRLPLPGLQGVDFTYTERMVGQLEAINIKRKGFFEFEGTPYHWLDVEVSKPTARGGQPWCG